MLLTACGSGNGSSSDSDKIAGADQDGPSDTAPPSTSATSSIKRPAIELPSDVQDSFENWSLGAAEKDAVLMYAKERIKATDAAIADADPNSEALIFYYKETALAEASAWVQAYVNNGKSITGTVRFFNPVLKMLDQNTAALAYCADESKAFDKGRKDGKTERTKATKNAYVTYNSRVEKNDQGLWQTASLISERGNSKCAR
ncbi:hypothetical protein [Streptomyces adustus]|uniref:hypothetical protein n=1 Tax=Streptomyces adustus TaxID=1609272 RepID=UPI003720974E